MNETQIRKYAEMMREMDLTGFEVTEADVRIRLERAGGSAPAQTVITTKANAPTTAPIPEETDYVSIKSPVVGVFYAASAENADPYVEVGDKVKSGQTVCLIEAMKLMTEITAETEGTITQICAANGQVVEYGTELFRISR